MKSNVSLVQNNAMVGAKIAVELANLKKEYRQLANKKFSLGGNTCGEQKQGATHAKPTGKH